MDLRPWDLWTAGGKPQPGTEEILTSLERAMELAGDDPTITEHLGDAYRQTAQLDKALGVYEQALRRAEGKEQEERLRKKIEAVRGSHEESGRDS